MCVWRPRGTNKRSKLDRNPGTKHRYTQLHKQEHTHIEAHFKLNNLIYLSLDSGKVPYYPVRTVYALGKVANFTKKYSGPAFL